VTFTIAGVMMAGGSAVALYSNTPANREVNPLAAVGVAVARQIAVLGAIVTVVLPDGRRDPGPPEAVTRACGHPPVAAWCRHWTTAATAADGARPG
jgi:hypothetical protein